VSATRRGGPARLPPDELAEFLDHPRWGAVCTEDASGRLCAEPVWMEPAGAGVLSLRSPIQLGDRGAHAPACVVADEFESYTQIRGAILRGDLELPGAVQVGRRGAMTFRISRSHGFTFEGSRTAL
jgi:hypothetical protein